MIIQFISLPSFTTYNHTSSYNHTPLLGYNKLAIESSHCVFMYTKANHTSQYSFILSALETVTAWLQGLLIKAILDI